MVAAPAEVSGLVAEELQKNEQLRAALQSMGGATSPQVARPSPELEGKLKAIALSKEHLELKQRIERGELQIKQLQEQVESDRVQMKKVQKQMDEYSRAGDPVWEKTGFGTIAYTDPFHTGLSKRTPTGGYFTS